MAVLNVPHRISISLRHITLPHVFVSLRKGGVRIDCANRQASHDQPALWTNTATNNGKKKDMCRGQ